LSYEQIEQPKVEGCWPDLLKKGQDEYLTNNLNKKLPTVSTNSIENQWKKHLPKK